MSERTFHSDAEIIAAIRIKKTVSAAAELLGCASSVIYERRRKSPDVAQAILEARMKIVDKAESKLEELVDAGDFRAVNLTLRTLGKDRGYVERVETREISDEALDREIEKERERERAATESSSSLPPDSPLGE